MVATPDPGEIPVSPRPGADPLAPYPVDPAVPPEVRPDGTQHAVVEDEVRVKVQAGKALDLADARSLVQRRYSFTPEGGGAVTELSLALADAAGAPVAAIDQSRPGAWLITYKVADANGNTVTVRLRYLVVSDPPEVLPKPGGGSGGSGGTGGSDPEPLPPTITVDPETGLSHAIVEDRVVVGTHSEPATAAMMAELFAERYELKSALADGKLTAGPMRLFNAAGDAVVVIDRSKPGTWRAEQTYTDSAGNTTTIRLTYEVQEGVIDSEGGSSGGNGSGASAAAGDGTGKLRPSGWATGLRQLPQTGGLFGMCPLHVMFVLLMLLTSAYAMMRLRQQQRDARKEARCESR